MGKEVFNFKDVEVIKNNGYLKPGQYVLGIKEAKFVKPDGKKPDGSAKTPYLDIKFGGEQGEVSAKMYITVKAVDRIQTLYAEWFGERCSKSFEGTDAVGAFFEMAFSSEKAKKVTKCILVEGRQAPDGKIYAEVPYSKFIIGDNVEGFKEGPFEPGTGQYVFHVRMTAPNPSTNTDDLMIPGMMSSAPTTNKSSSVNSNDMDDDLPF
jgi:hypothetical protein